MSLREASTPHGGILYDEALVSAPADTLFDPEHWRARDALAGRGSGRGAVYYVTAGAAQWVLRRYRRGGVVGRWIEETFVYLGASRTRSFHELRLLATLHARGFPVPRPVAGRYQRRGPAYTCDLITERIAAQPLSSWLAEGPLAESRWRAIGRMVGCFHAAGVWHADLTAHNILLDDAGTPYLLDFDRGRLRAPGRWRERNLARLQRSLRKISPRLAAGSYAEREWQWLLAGYAATPETGTRETHTPLT